MHPSHFLKIHLNTVLPSKPGSFEWSLFLRFPHQNPIYTSTAPICATCTVHLILLDLIARIIFGEEYRPLRSSLCSLLHSPFTSPLLGPNFFLSTLVSLSAYFPPWMWATKFHTHTKKHMSRIHKESLTKNSACFKSKCLFLPVPYIAHMFWKGGET